VLLFSNTFNPDDMRIIAQSDGIDGHEPARFAYTENPRTGKVGATVVTNRLGQTSRYRFNDNFQAVKITDELGNSSIYPYDANGKLTRQTQSQQLHACRNPRPIRVYPKKRHPWQKPPIDSQHRLRRFHLLHDRRPCH